MDGKVWGSENDGYSWKELFPGKNVIAVYQNPKFEERVCVLRNACSYGYLSFVTLGILYHGWHDALCYTRQGQQL